MKKPSLVAVHEVAHAVTAHVLGVKVRQIEIESDEVGCCDTEGTSCVLTGACIMLAGHEAEIMWFGANPQYFPESDLEDLRRVSVSITGCNIIRDPVIKFLKQSKKTIWHIARELDRRKKITRRVFLRLIKERTK